MAVLIVELHGIKRGAVLPRRVLIGRRSMNHLVIDDAGVSRMHAWIEGEGDRYYINDAGSRTGTRVNGQRIVTRHLLGDEDEISIGPAKMTFLAESRLRPGVEPIDLASPPKIAPSETGIAFDCPSCKAPLWASPNFAGGTGQCKYCGSELVVPSAGSPPKAAPPRSADKAPAGPAPQAGKAPHAGKGLHAGKAPLVASRFAPSQAEDELQVSLDRDGIDAGAQLAAQPTKPSSEPAKPRTVRPKHAAPPPRPASPAPARTPVPPVQDKERAEFDALLESSPILAPKQMPPQPGQTSDTPQPRPAAQSTPVQAPPGTTTNARRAASTFALSSDVAADAVSAHPLPDSTTAAPSRPGRRLGKDEHFCGVCQSVISIFEEQTSCPHCKLVFHAGCWEENYGCSAYGCPQVNALRPPEQHDAHDHNGVPAIDAHFPGAHPAGVHLAGVDAAHSDAKDSASIDRPARFPWEFLLLAGSVFSALVGALTFGLPSLALAGGTVAYIARSRGQGGVHRGVVLLSAGLGLLGVIAGVPVSWFLYFGGAHAYLPAR